MFGQKEDGQMQDDAMQVVSDDAANQLVNEPVSSDGSATAGTQAVASANTAPAPTPGWLAANDQSSSGTTTEEATKDVISPAGGYPSAPSNRVDPNDTIDIPVPEIVAVPAEEVTPAPSLDDAVSAEDLINIKQKALSELVPLIDKLDQPPEEKFRTIMMMIQASDDQRLVEKAYESAHAIENEESRAQALLDIVNEINYFTHPQAPITTS